MNRNLTPQQLAEQWCAKHPEIIGDGGGNTAMDKAVKIIAVETSTEKGRADLFRAAAPFGASFLDSIPGQPHPATDFLGARDLLASGRPAASLAASAGAAAAASSSPSPAAAAGTAPRGTVASELEECPYCKEPTSRFCKETGRRHETSAEKANRRWKTVFRQLSMASSFVSNVRLSKKNSCVEDGGVELIF